MNTRPKTTYFSISILLMIACMVLGPTMGHAKKILKQQEVSTLRGTVRVTGEIPNPQRFNLVLFSDPYYCGRISDGTGWRLAPMAHIGQNNELPGAVVYIKEGHNIESDMKTDPIITTKNCVYVPFTSTARVGQTLRFQNWDPVLHKLEVFLVSSKGAKPLLAEYLQPHPKNRKADFLTNPKIGRLRSGKEVYYRLRDSGILVYRCSLHDYMQGWTIVLEHPHFAITENDGTFSIPNLPIGTYTLVAWHPLGIQEKMIQIHSQPEHKITISLRPTVPTSHTQEKQDSNPFGIDLLGDSRIVPSVEKQRLPSHHSKKEGVYP